MVALVFSPEYQTPFRRKGVWEITTTTMDNVLTTLSAIISGLTIAMSLHNTVTTDLAFQPNQFQRMTSHLDVSVILDFFLATVAHWQLAIKAQS